MLVFHVLMSELNFVAPWNIEVVTVVVAVPRAQLAIAMTVPLSKLVSLRNIFAKVVTFVSFQIFPAPADNALFPLLNAVAPLNIADMFVTVAVLQLLTSWLNEVAPWNMEAKVVEVADPGVQLAIPTLKAVAPLNIFAKVVTLETSHLLPTVAGIATLLSLNKSAPWNIEDMLVTV